VGETGLLEVIGNKVHYKAGKISETVQDGDVVTTGSNIWPIK